MRILLIEDEARFAEALAFNLIKAGYPVEIAANGVTGLEMASSKAFDLIILDRMLPGMDGVSVLKEIRDQGVNIPVIFLTAKDTVADRVAGLDAGADDYLVKPFAKEELLARLRALSRRTEQITVDKLQAGGLVLAPLRCEAYCENTTIRLTFKETQLLELLMKNHDIVLTKELIFEKIWGLASDVELANIETHICYLRRKLATLSSRVDIVTIRGVGYCLETIRYE